MTKPAVGATGVAVAGFPGAAGQNAPARTPAVSASPSSGFSRPPLRLLRFPLLCPMALINLLTAATRGARALPSVCIFGQNPSPPPKPGVKTPGVQMPIAGLTPEAVFQVPGAPDWIAVDDAVWISNKPKDEIVRLDPKKNEIVARVTPGKRPCSGLASGFGSLWVPNCGDQTLSRI